MLSSLELASGPLTAEATFSANMSRCEGVGALSCLGRFCSCLVVEVLCWIFFLLGSCKSASWLNFLWQKRDTLRRCRT